MRQGGTILGTTNKGDPFAYPMPDGTLKDRSGEIIDAFKELGCEALIGIGGDGSLAILSRLAKQGNFPLIGIPKTIDNDLGATEMSVGFGTAVDVATEALDRLQPTAASHDPMLFSFPKSLIKSQISRPILRNCVNEDVILRWLLSLRLSWGQMVKA